MRILHLSFSDHHGGAARAAWRLHDGLRRAGHDSQMLVMRKYSQDDNVHQVRLGRLGRWQRQRQMPSERPDRARYPAYAAQPWDVGQASSPVERHIRALKPDVIHLHWINDGMLSVAQIGRLPAPLVWTLHDLWPLTGGCHYDAGCGRFAARCGACPILGSTDENDLSRRTFADKVAQWVYQDVTLVALNPWMRAQISASFLFGGRRTVEIPNGIDLSVYKPSDQASARQHFGLPPDKRLILFGAFDLNDPRKGGDLLKTALAGLNLADVALVTLGGGDASALADSGLPLFSVGRIDDEARMALLYAAADVFVSPSRQDNLPNMVMEALACGLPVVAFKVGGLPAMLTHQQTGWLAAAEDTDDLRAGIGWVLTDRERWRKLADAAHAYAHAHYALDDIAGQMAALYSQILKSDS